MKCYNNNEHCRDPKLKKQQRNKTKKNPLKLLIYIDLNHETLTETQNTTPTMRDDEKRK